MVCVLSLERNNSTRLLPPLLRNDSSQRPSLVFNLDLRLLDGDPAVLRFLLPEISRYSYVTSTKRTALHCWLPTDNNQLGPLIFWS